MEPAPQSFSVHVNKARSRHGIPASERRRLWLALALGSPQPGWSATSLTLTVDAATQIHLRLKYVMALKSVFGNVDPVPRRLFSVPFLGVEPHFFPAEAAVLLSQPSIAVSAAHDRIVSVLAQLRGLQFAPQVPPLVLVLLSVMTEWEAWAVADALLSRPGDAGSAPLLLQTRQQQAAFTRTFRTLLKSYFPQLSAHSERLGSRRVFTAWFNDFFVGWLPVGDVLCIVDAFMVEGPKVLIRYGLAMLKLNKRALKGTSSAQEFSMALRMWAVPTASAVAATTPLPKMPSGGGEATGVATHVMDARAAADAARSPSHVLGGAAGSSAGTAASSPAGSHLGGGNAAASAPAYSFEKLSDTSFNSLRRLSRRTISKLTARFLAENGGGIAGNDEGGGGGSPGVAASSGSTAPVTAIRPPVPAGTGAEGSHFGVPGGASDANSPSRGGTTVAEWGAGQKPDPRTLAHTGPTPPSAPAPTQHTSDSHTHVMKVVGVGCRLMSPTFSAPDRLALRMGLTDPNRDEAVLRAMYPGPDAPRTTVYSPELWNSFGLTLSPTASFPGNTTSRSQYASGSDGNGGQVTTRSLNPAAAGTYSASPRVYSGSAPASASDLQPPTASAESTGVPTGALGDRVSASPDGCDSPSASGIVAAYRVAHEPFFAAAPLINSPHVATLVALLPTAVQGSNATCVYSTDIHGWSLGGLYSRTGGLGPLLVLLQVEMIHSTTAAAATTPSNPLGATATTTTSSASSRAHSTLRYPASAAADKFSLAVSTRRPVIGFCVNRGLVSPACARANTSSRSGGGGGGGWSGSARDFMCVLFPEPVFLPATPPSVLPSPTAPKHASSQREMLPLPSSHFSLALADRLVIGGRDASPLTPALTLAADLQVGALSRAFLEGAGLGGGGGSSGAGDFPEDESRISVLSLEAYAFLGEDGATFHENGMTPLLRTTRELYQTTQQAYWRVEEA